jgi:glycosyltransferase involved in cell wall biosynthesis
MEKYLLRCLNSVSNQTLKEIEIICINDGSTDGSLQILLDYAQNDNRIKVIDKENTGYGDSMNIGIDKAVGDYIGILESDDYIHPEKYEILYRTAVENKAEIVKSNYYNYTNSPKEETVFFEALKDCQYNQIFEPMEEHSIFFASPSIWSAIYSKCFLDDNNIRFLNTEGASYQDTSFYFKTCFCAKRMCAVKDSLTYYWLDNENSSVNNPRKVFCVCDELDEISCFLSKFGKKHQWEIALRYKYQVYMWNYNRLSHPYQYAFIVRMAEEFRSDLKKGYFNSRYWSKTDKQLLDNITIDYDTFFQMTSKNNMQTKIQIEIPFYIHLDDNKLEDTMKLFNHIIIYGAGRVGKYTAKYLLHKLERNIDQLSFAVSDERDQPDQVEGISVYRIDTLNNFADDGIVIIAARESIQLDMLIKIKKAGFKNYFRLQEQQIKKISQWVDDSKV